SETIYESQHEEIKHKLLIEGKQRELEFARKTEEMERAIAAIKSLTVTEGLKLKAEEASKQLALNLVELETTLKTQEKELQGNLAAEETRKLIGAVELQQRKAVEDLELEIAAQNLGLRVEELKAEVDAVVSKAGAVSPDLIAALQAFSDKALAEKMAETMAPKLKTNVT
ncbi:MAG: hypothetical protein EAZ97_16165, partial [Bacteroidetes bacterium]